MRRNSVAPAGPKWEPVVNERPRFSSPAEVAAWQQATRDTPRLPGEEAWEWAERVARAARGVHEMPPDVRLPYREPGEDDE